MKAERIADYERIKSYHKSALEHAMNDAREGKELSFEFSDLMKYLRLSILREHKMITEDGLKELNAIVQRNNRALVIESSRDIALNKPFNSERYERVLLHHRSALEHALDEAKKGKELSPEFSDFVKYLKLSILRENEMITEDELKELNTIVICNIRAAEIEMFEKQKIKMTGKKAKHNSNSNNIPIRTEEPPKQIYNPDVPKIDFEAIKKAEQEQRTR